MSDGFMVGGGMKSSRVMGRVLSLPRQTTRYNLVAHSC
jgi:hypothetical protein